MDRGRQGAPVTSEAVLSGGGDSGGHDPRAAYTSRLEARRRAAAQLEQQHARFSTGRLLLFGSALAVLAWVGWPALPWLPLWLLPFAGLAFWHARVLNARDRAARGVAYYERGLANLDGRWPGTGNTGERYRPDHHLYADDLDLFGRGSLFQRLSTARTRGGEARLANWLLAPSPPDEIRGRQAAVRELAPRLDLREALAVLGPEMQSTVDSDGLRAWAAAPPTLTSRWPRLLLPLLAGLTVATVGWWIWRSEPPPGLGPLLLLQALVGLWFRSRVRTVAHAMEHRDPELSVLSEVLGLLEREEVSSPRLRELSQALRASGHVPSVEIRKLARLADLLASRDNQIFAPFAALLFLGTQLSFAVEAWRRRCGPSVAQWLEVASEFEALSALAAYASEHPDDPMPDVTAGPPHFAADALRHPLLQPDQAVANDLRLGGAAPHLLLISGSNMSGKSTWLRTVGTNAVLAQAGAPVRAARLTMSPLLPGATLRVQDSLQEGQSRFFAEITRISRVVAAARRSTPPVLFLLDEVLAGTNSHDRRHGAEGIVRGLLRLGAVGLVTTHDLALAELVTAGGLPAENLHFADDFREGTLHFDYRLRPGIVQSSNALELMRSVGLEV